MRFLPRAAATLATAGTLAALAAGSATADPESHGRTAITGSPLTVWVGDQGQLQAKRDTDASNIFFDAESQVGDAGFFLAFPTVTGVPAQNATLAGHVFGFDGPASRHPTDTDQFVPVSQQATTGSGTPADPFTQVTTYAVSAGEPATQFALVTQTTTYINGGQLFDVRWDVKNLTASALRFKALTAADFYFENDDRGTGIFTQGPPRFIGGTNADTGRSGGFVEVAAPSPALPWSHYQALAYKFPEETDGNDVWTRVEHAGDAATPSFDDTVLGEPADNAGAVEWDQYLDPAQTLAAGATASFALRVRTALPAALQFDQTNAGAPQGVPITFTVTAKDTADTPFAGKRLISAITGANPGTQSALIGADGRATVTDPGTNAGPDTIVSFIDLNGDGTRQPNEPQGSALATFVDKTPPTCKVGVSGDRAGTGGAGKPLVITVNCDSPATVTSAATLTIQPATPRARASSAAASAAKAKKKPKHKKKAKKPKKPKKVVVTLVPTTASVAPGQAVPLSVNVPASVVKKYPGATATASVTVTAIDTAGNRASTTATKKVTIAKPKAKPKKKHKAKHKKKPRK